MIKILKDTPFSDMNPLGFVTRGTVWDDMSKDSEGHILSKTQGEMTHLQQENRVALQYTAKESIERRRAATHCVLCAKEFSRFSEKQGDHNHKTGEWRGVLCVSCNMKVGWFEFMENNPDFVAAIKKYLHL